MKTKLPAMLIIISLIALLIFSACPSPSTPPPPSDNNSLTPPQANGELKDTEPPTQVAETQYPLTITDDIGRTVTMDKMPLRIVSLAPSITETLFALGLSDRIVGVTDYCDYPEAAKLKPRVSSFTTPNTEKLISVEPDIIFADSIHEKTVVPALEKLNLTVVVFSATSVDALLNDVQLMGQITNTNQEASVLTTGMKARISAVTDKTDKLPDSSRPLLVYIIWHDPIWTMGRNTVINDLFNYAGGSNIYAGEFEKQRIVSIESIITSNPQIIIVSGMGSSGDKVFDAIKKEERLRTTKAFINNRIYKISDSNIIERPGPRVVEGLEELAKLLHPEIFGQRQ
jgi:iron complex transport system substrate-binding protein